MSGAAGFEAGAASHPGQVRLENEDAVLANTAAGLWAVADGMGGHDAGQLASRTIVEALGGIEAPDSAADLLARCEARIVEANARLLRIGADRGTLVGSTLAVLLAHADDFACIWSGDSRIYRVRAGAAEPLTKDHTEVQELVDQGAMTAHEAKLSSRRNIVTRAIGTVLQPELEIVHGRLVPDDVFVLCSDGLTAHVDDHEIGAATTGRSPQQAADALVALALARGGTDNVTVLVTRYGGMVR